MGTFVEAYYARDNDGCAFEVRDATDDVVYADAYTLCIVSLGPMAAFLQERAMSRSIGALR